MYNLQELFDKLEQFKIEASASSSAIGKGNKAAGGRARALSIAIGKEFKEFRKQSVAKNV